MQCVRADTAKRRKSIEEAPKEVYISIQHPALVPELPARTIPSIN